MALDTNSKSDTQKQVFVAAKTAEALSSPVYYTHHFMKKLR